jgi:hypothetical protein
MRQRIDALQMLVVESKMLEGEEAQILDEYVGAPNHLEQDLAVLRLIEVERD